MNRAWKSGVDSANLRFQLPPLSKLRDARWSALRPCCCNAEFSELGCLSESMTVVIKNILDIYFYCLSPIIYNIIL